MIVDLAMEKQRAKRQRPIRAHGTPGQVAGAATEYSPSSKLIVQNGLPNSVLPERPRPGHRTLTPVGPEQQLSSVSFMPRGALVDSAILRAVATSIKRLPTARAEQQARRLAKRALASPGRRNRAGRA